MKRISWLLSNISNNINQIAKYFNTGGLHSQAVTAELGKALDAVLQIQVDVTRMTEKGPVDDVIKFDDLLDVSGKDIVDIDKYLGIEDCEFPDYTE